jgi:hypothetical protein
MQTEGSMRQQLEPYRPSTGTEGDWFDARFCDRCAHDAAWREHEDLQYTNPRLAGFIEQRGAAPEPCEILSNALCFGVDDEGYPRDTWVYFNDKPTCLAFRDKDGSRGAQPATSPDPAQGDLFAPLPVLIHQNADALATVVGWTKQYEAQRPRLARRAA